MENHEKVTRYLIGQIRSAAKGCHFPKNATIRIQYTPHHEKVEQWLQLPEHHFDSYECYEIRLHGKSKKAKLTHRSIEETVERNICAGHNLRVEDEHGEDILWIHIAIVRHEVNPGKLERDKKAETCIAAASKRAKPWVYAEAKRRTGIALLDKPNRRPSYHGYRPGPGPAPCIPGPAPFGFAPGLGPAPGPGFISPFGPGPAPGHFDPYGPRAFGMRPVKPDFGNMFNR